MNLLVTGAWKCTEEQLNSLRGMGNEIRFMQCETDVLPVSYDWAEGVICNGLFLHHPIEKFRSLRYIQLISAGFERVPMDFIKDHGIEICNARGVYSIPMSEFALCGVLQLYKQSRFFLEKQKLHKWEKHRDLLELNGKTVVIVGCGSVGTECAKRFQALGCKTVGVDLSVGTDDVFSEIVGLSRLDEVLVCADIVVLALPLTQETFHLINKDRLSALKDTAILVNIARGAVIDETALIESIPRLGGAVLDVFEEEPLPEESPLWDAENVILTPHNSFVGDHVKERLFQLIIGNLKRNAQ